MNNNQKIKYIKHEDIDSEKWNRCIENAPNSRFYANDWHLDRTAVVWDALIWGDYEFVMPLTFRRKLGISYLYQPLFCQQLGIFPSPPNKIAAYFYSSLVKKFRYSDIQLNSQNQSVNVEAEVDLLSRENYLLPLNNDYKTISNGFSKNTKRNLKKANSNNLKLIAGIRLEDYLAFKSINLQINLGKKELGKLKSIIAFGQYKGFGEIHGVYTAENELCAAVYFCRWENRVIYMNAASNSQGKELRGMYFLVDNFIQANAEKNLILDFEGSMIPGVARFYGGFGASPETYFQLKFNRLPLPLKWLKRK
ncbi:MAG: hypothetical protein HN778_22115 [Prolixibacteraceae bacterium]|jgi:hypothetical protein|nr:hypothetical protein [Prolixibacteraceae bacterium]MBT6004890.1 hypothetical protein [Prolixibacteraceae bacterium]MBT6764517.1 hypothetical protein [Prolixibacteraceae bacterium]MBT6997345.1 hypothetical protein [Prolixibacteraceae bacterium]MBT7397534.1 hypothetical protein [Prolixibacteraceae bacterium]